MTTAVRVPVQSPAVWAGSDVARSDDWIHRFTAAEVAEIESALRHAKAADKTLRTVTREDFPLPTLEPLLRAWARELDRGRGVLLLRGFPVDRLSKEDAGLAYYAFGLHLGTAVSQNAAGDVLGHVRDLGIPRTGPSVRLYATRERQEFHTDGADLVGLLCLGRAKSGGESRIVSSMAVYNEILRRRPDLVELLFAPWHWDRNDEQPAGDPPFFSLPICYVIDGRLRFFFIGWYVRDAQRHPEVPRLTAPQLELLDLIETIANDPRLFLEMDFQIGDIQLLKNSVILHSREAYVDYDEPDRKRHLLRLWLTAHDFSSVEDVLRSGIPERAR